MNQKRDKIRINMFGSSLQYVLLLTVAWSYFPCTMAFPIPHSHVSVHRVKLYSSSNSDDGDTPTNNPPPYKTRSTADPEPTTQFSTGSESRRLRLDAALTSLGISPLTLTTSPSYRGTSALRTYTSFLLPKSPGAYAVAESPQRAAVVANNISFYMREHESHRTEWLRNHDKSLAEAEELLSATSGRKPLTIVLDNVRSAHNVGNILRAAEAARVEEVVLCGITPAPPDPKVLKTALRSAAYVPHSSVGSTMEAVRRLRAEGVTVYGVETTERSVSLWEVEMKAPLALVFGNEVVGVHAEVLKVCDGLVSVPMLGVKNSLNVATCASIVVWEALRRWELEGG